MPSRLIIDGNTVYEIDEECIRKKEKEQNIQDEKNQKSKFPKELKSYSYNK